MTDTTTQADMQDLITHRIAWRSAIKAAKDAADGSDQYFWAHELKVFDRTFAGMPALLAERDALAAQLAAAEARARESALDALAAYGQAADAHTAQLAAEAKLATARGEAMEAVQALQELATSLAEYRHRTKKIAFDVAMRADRADEAARAAIRALAKGGAT